MLEALGYGNVVTYHMNEGHCAFLVLERTCLAMMEHGLSFSEARELVQAYVEAGAAKIHLDASMRLADDPPGALDEELAARRTADLAEAAERSRQRDLAPPVFVVGTEVPIPGGETDDDAPPTPTRPEDAARTVDLTRAAFRARGLAAAWERELRTLRATPQIFPEIDSTPRSADCFRIRPGESSSPWTPIVIRWHSTY